MKAESFDARSLGQYRDWARYLREGVGQTLVASLLVIFLANINSLTPIFGLAILINEQNYALADSSPSEGKIIARNLPTPTSTDNRAEWYQKP
jgi:hypothetical protein